MHSLISGDVDHAVQRSSGFPWHLCDPLEPIVAIVLAPNPMTPGFLPICESFKRRNFLLEETLRLMDTRDYLAKILFVCTTGIVATSVVIAVVVIVLGPNPVTRGFWAIRESFKRRNFVLKDTPAIARCGYSSFVAPILLLVVLLSLPRVLLLPLLLPPLLLLAFLLLTLHRYHFRGYYRLFRLLETGITNNNCLYRLYGIQ